MLRLESESERSEKDLEKTKMVHNISVGTPNMRPFVMPFGAVRSLLGTDNRAGVEWVGSVVEDDICSHRGCIEGDS